MVSPIVPIDSCLSSACGTPVNKTLTGDGEVADADQFKDVILGGQTDSKPRCSAELVDEAGERVGLLERVVAHSDAAKHQQDEEKTKDTASG